MSWSFVLLGSLLLGCASKRAIHGQVLDRNGEPVDRVIVSLEPGNIELVTDSEGRFVIDYLRDDAGKRVHLSAREEYVLEAFRAGYHLKEHAFFYTRGSFVLEPMMLTEDTIRLGPSEADIDPARISDRPTTSGSAYEGE